MVIDVPDDAVGARLEEMLSCAYSVSVFTRFEPGRNRVWAKHRVQPGDVADEHGVVVAPGLADDLWGGRISDVEQHPVEGVDTAAASPQARGAGAVERAAAALPAGVHPERRRRACRRSTCCRSPRRRRCGPGSWRCASGWPRWR
ncbi:hypothetical protein GCM10025868_22360 [Angustibacter aerolatus]|uniref:Uncharacterized protein n=1 Tax=Angustibacter aerolatus TaxID=1162965 RepID=A0ABQ6JHG2_9ACTN|nr:hypothetical protein GCM10025868_22360 [Angustibacter aerolatus]